MRDVFLRVTTRKNRVLYSVVCHQLADRDWLYFCTVLKLPVAVDDW